MDRRTWSWQRLKCRSGLGLSQVQLIGLLKVQPELRAGAKGRVPLSSVQVSLSAAKSRPMATTSMEPVRRVILLEIVVAMISISLGMSAHS